VGWIKRFILFHHKQHPAEMGKPEIEQFLTALAVKRRVAASTQNQALAALLFLYKEVLARNPGWLDDIVRAKRPQRLPVVLTRPEVEALLTALDGVSWIMALLLYGSGLRLMECLQLRVKDVTFARNEILVREGKGNKDRVTMLPAAVKQPLLAHLDAVRRLHERDLKAGYGRVRLPDALARKYPIRRMAHRDVKTTMIYTHVLNRGGHGVQSPADRLLAGASGVLARSGEPRSTPDGAKPS